MILERIVRERNISAPDPKTLAKWRYMTSENNHSKVRRDIARYFGDDDRLLAFQWLRECCGRERFTFHGQRIDTLGLSNDLTTGMIRDIELVFGKEVADRVSSCL